MAPIKAKPKSRRKKVGKQYYKKRSLGKALGQGPDYHVKPGTVVFPPVKNYILSFAETISLTPAAGGYSGTTYRGNSIYQPSTSTAFRPRYYDTLLGPSNTSDAPYGAYCVNAFKAELYVRNVSDTHLFVSISAYPTSTGASPITLVEARERPDTIVRQVSPLGSGPATAKLTMYRKNNKVLGVKDFMDNEDAKGFYNANPADSVSVVIIAWNPDGTVGKQLKGDLRMRYYCTLFRLNDVMDS